MTKNYISEENKKRLDAALIAWDEAGHRIWPDNIMAEVFSRQLSCCVTKTHANHARIRTDRKVTANRPHSVADIEHMARTLGMMPVSPHELSPIICSAWEKVMAAAIALDQLMPMPTTNEPAAD